MGSAKNIKPTLTHSDISEIMVPWHQEKVLHVDMRFKNWGSAMVCMSAPAKLATLTIVPRATDPPVCVFDVYF